MSNPEKKPSLKLALKLLIVVYVGVFTTAILSSSKSEGSTDRYLTPSIYCVDQYNNLEVFPFGKTTFKDVREAFKVPEISGVLDDMIVLGPGTPKGSGGVTFTMDSTDNSYRYEITCTTAPHAKTNEGAPT